MVVLGFPSLYDEELWWTTEFRKTTSVNSKWTTCLEFTVADSVSVTRNHVFCWPFGFRGGVVKLCNLLPLWDIWFQGEVRRGEWHGSRELMTGNGSLSPGDVGFLAWCFVI